MQLEKLSCDLGALSGALAGGREMSEMLDRVVETMMKVLGADASALFVVDEVNQQGGCPGSRWVSEATGGRRRSIRLGEGITGWIAREGRVVRARTLEELHAHPAWKGKYTMGAAASRTLSWDCRSL